MSYRHGNRWSPIVQVVRSLEGEEEGKEWEVEGEGGGGVRGGGRARWEGRERRSERKVYDLILEVLLREGLVPACYNTLSIGKSQFYLYQLL